jgi:hypothetical protein
MQPAWNISLPAMSATELEPTGDSSQSRCEVNGIEVEATGTSLGSKLPDDTPVHCCKGYKCSSGQWVKRAAIDCFTRGTFLQRFRPLNFPFR